MWTNYSTWLRVCFTICQRGRSQGPGPGWVGALNGLACAEGLDQAGACKCSEALAFSSMAAASLVTPAHTFPSS